MVTKTRPSAYEPPLPFHATRAITALSVVVVGGVLSFFCYRLTAEDFKLPWIFLVMLLADLLVLLSLIVGTTFYFCSRLSPLLNMIVNAPILLLWTAGMALFIWNMYGTLGRSCSVENWGNSDGVSVCNKYKAFFAFVVIGWLSQIALIVLDVRARRNQISRGRYDKMDDSQDMKLQALDGSRDSSTQNLPFGSGLDGAQQRLQQQQLQERELARQEREFQQQQDQYYQHQEEQYQQEQQYQQHQHQQYQQYQQQYPMQRALTRESSFTSESPSRAPTYTTQPQRHDLYTDAPHGGHSYQPYNPNPRFEPTYTSGHNISMNDYGYKGPTQNTHYDNYYGR